MRSRLRPQRGSTTKGSKEHEGHIYHEFTTERLLRRPAPAGLLFPLEPSRKKTPWSARRLTDLIRNASHHPQRLVHCVRRVGVEAGLELGQ